MRLTIILGPLLVMVQIYCINENPEISNLYQENTETDKPKDNILSRAIDGAGKAIAGAVRNVATFLAKPKDTFNNLGQAFRHPLRTLEDRLSSGSGECAKDTAECVGGLLANVALFGLGGPAGALSTASTVSKYGADSLALNGELILTSLALLENWIILQQGDRLRILFNEASDAASKLITHKGDPDLFLRENAIAKSNLLAKEIVKSGGKAAGFVNSGWDFEKGAFTPEALNQLNVYRAEILFGAKDNSVSLLKENKVLSSQIVSAMLSNIMDSQRKLIQWVTSQGFQLTPEGLQSVGDLNLLMKKYSEGSNMTLIQMKEIIQLANRLPSMILKSDKLQAFISTQWNFQTGTFK